jgi:hypothetical protein
MLKQLAPLALLLLPFAAFAAGDNDGALLLAPPQSVAPAEASPAPGAGRLSLGLGTGMNRFGGNIGQLYSASSPVAEVRGEWALSRLFSARLGAAMANYSFNAAPNGAVDVSENSLEAAAQCHFLSTALAGGGFDPYVSVGAAQVFRSQEYQDHNDVEKDNAFAVSAGIGTNYLPNGGKLGFYAEADANQIFFQDRFSEEYLPSGVEDLTGLMYSARLGVKYIF